MSDITEEDYEDAKAEADEYMGHLGLILEQLKFRKEQTPFGYARFGDKLRPVIEVLEKALKEMEEYPNPWVTFDDMARDTAEAMGLSV